MEICPSYLITCVKNMYEFSNKQLSKTFFLMLTLIYFSYRLINLCNWKWMRHKFNEVFGIPSWIRFFHSLTISYIPCNSSRFIIVFITFLLVESKPETVLFIRCANCHNLKTSIQIDTSRIKLFWTHSITLAEITFYNLINSEHN